ncbi:TMV resistance protein N-like [Lactuca sativa]|uniref:TMV resistance protein N-like n=1 Tax=Lactuca sativa TaxID=4236 RepID=UPI000CD873D6|nr:TMV resistance protein N-like [Lactuca sativa]
METRIKDIVSYLETASDDVCMIGIWRIGGGGKITLARAIFDQISFQFEGKSFIENVREVSSVPLSGLKLLRKQVLSHILYDQGINISSVSEGKNMLWRMMRARKALSGERNWFKSGSTIIITTRDKQVLVAHGVKLIHNVNLLSDKEATCLFSKYVYGREIPIQGYEELLTQVVHYVLGLPLTIIVLGLFLCAKDEVEWIDALERLKTIPLMETQKNWN